MYSDERLVKKALQDDKRAFRKLLTRYQDQILFLLNDILGDYGQAKEAAHKVFQKAWGNLNAIPNKISFSSWLYKFAIDSAFKMQKKPRDEKGKKFETKLPSRQFKTSGKDVEKDKQFDEFGIQSALLEISSQQRITIILRYFHKKSVKQIADIMQWREDTVRIHIQRAVDRLGTILRDTTR